ncbi:hypothetical protein LXA43DRAFT_457250 [Ganoderma leucocontextum]|nr:hypothetical protein LXA43DRAFT_457250 [Ganoderma leucocontextum]
MGRRAAFGGSTSTLGTVAVCSLSHTLCIYAPRFSPLGRRWLRRYTISGVVRNADNPRCPRKSFGRLASSRLSSSTLARSALSIPIPMLIWGPVIRLRTVGRRSSLHLPLKRTVDTVHTRAPAPVHTFLTIVFLCKTTSSFPISGAGTHTAMMDFGCRVSYRLSHIDTESLTIAHYPTSPSALSPHTPSRPIPPICPSYSIFSPLLPFFFLVPCRVSHSANCTIKLCSQQQHGVGSAAAPPLLTFWSVILPVGPHMHSPSTTYIYTHAHLSRSVLLALVSSRFVSAQCLVSSRLTQCILFLCFCTNSDTPHYHLLANYQLTFTHAFGPVELGSNLTVCLSSSALVRKNTEAA